MNPDALLWRYAKRAGNARRPLQKGGQLEERVHAQLAEIGKHSGVAYVSSL